MTASSDIIAAVATAPGRGGIGIVRVSGPRLDALIAGVLGRTPPPRRAVLARFRAASGEALDQGLALFFPAPHSYTGEEVLELHGHGGPLVLKRVLERCLELGARVAEPGEFTRRAFLNDKLDLAQAESVADLIDAATTQAARSAMRSLSGEFSFEIQRLKEMVVDVRLRVEAALDFPEEEIDALDRQAARDRVHALLQQLDRVLAAARQGSLLREGLRIVLAGRPNVGKSSLLNRLAGEELAIVTDIPGTTRDVIRQVIDLDGVPAYLLDTAGLRETQDPVERLGVERTREAIRQADLVILLMDATCGEVAEDRAIQAALPPEQRGVRVFNKIDLLPRDPALVPRADRVEVWLSAKTGAGLPLLRRALLEAAGWQAGVEGVFLARARHLRALEAARRHAVCAADRIAQPELFAEELRLAHRELSAITGEYTADDLLGEIFSRFCIGK
jgi:tRNA modification GTPase